LQVLSHLQDLYFKKKKNDANVKQEDWLGVKTSRRWESRRRGKRRGRYD
jgi:hypothetical protein